MNGEQFARKLDEVTKRLDALEAAAHIIYGKGTYTPTYVGGTAAGATTYTLQHGAWRRKGSEITATGSVVWTAATGTGNARISLPFTTANVANQNYSGSVRVTTVTFANSAPQVIIVPNTTFFELTSPLTNTASTAVAVEAAGNIVFTIVYFID